MDTGEYVALLVGAVVVLVAALAVRVSTRVGVPSLLLWGGIGMALGDNGLGIRFDDARLARNLGLGALVVILAEGGLSTRWPVIRPVVPAAVVLSTVGVFVSVALTALAAHLLFGQDWRHAVLLGAIVSATDAAAVFSTLRRLRLPPRLVGLMEAESGFNDAPVVILVMLLSQEPLRPTLEKTWLLGYELVIGTAVGLAVGWVATFVLRRAALPAAGLYPLATLAFCVLAYTVASLAHASGFAAVYLAAVWLGNARLPHRRATLGFADGLAWLAQIGLFVMLGLLVTPSELPAVVGPALGVGAALLLVARPASVLVSLAPFRMPLRQQALVSWAGLRGAVPIVLATVPRTTGLAGAQRLFNAVFVLVGVFTLIQAPSIGWVARRLRLATPGETRELTVESAPLEELGADLLQLRIPPASRLNGVEVFELRLPAGAAVTLVVRDGRSFVPDAYTRLRHGDELLIVATSDARTATEDRLRAVSRRGKLAGWFDEPGR